MIHHRSIKKLSFLKFLNNFRLENAKCCVNSLRKALRQNENISSSNFDVKKSFIMCDDESAVVKWKLTHFHFDSKFLSIFTFRK